MYINMFLDISVWPYSSCNFGGLSSQQKKTSLHPSKPFEIFLKLWNINLYHMNPQWFIAIIQLCCQVLQSPTKKYRGFFSKWEFIVRIFPMRIDVGIRAVCIPLQDVHTDNILIELNVWRPITKDKQWKVWKSLELYYLFI